MNIVKGLTSVLKGLLSIVTFGLYNPNAKQEQELKTMRQNYQSQIEKIKKQMVSVEDFKKQKQKLLIVYLEELKKYKFSEAINREQGKKYVCVIGNTSAGKSTLLNIMYTLKLKTGLGTTTQTCVKVADIDNRVEIWDAPGINQDFQFFSPSTLRFFSDLDLVIVCFSESVLNNKLLIRALAAIRQNKKTILVRTKCNLRKESQISLQEVLKNDYKQLGKITEQNIQILQVGDTKELHMDKLKDIIES